MDAVGAGLDARRCVLIDAEAAVAVAVPVDADVARRMPSMHAARRSARGSRRPSGVAWPTVSQTQRRCAPRSIARREQRRSVSGRARVVSSVTYITGRPCLDREGRSPRRCSLQHESQRPVLGVLADRRGADEAQHLDRDAGLLRDVDDRLDVVRSCVRAAQLACTCSFGARRSPAPAARRPRTTCGPAPGRPMSAVSMPSASIRCRMRELLRDRRVAHRRRLQAVAQRLVVEHHTRRRPARRSRSSRRSASQHRGIRRLSTKPAARPSAATAPELNASRTDRSIPAA